VSETGISHYTRKNVISYLTQPLRNDELTRVIERILWIGLKGGWTDVHNDEWQREFDSIVQTVEKPSTQEPKSDNSPNPNSTPSSP
jgi:hypothetical protein